MQNSHSPPPRPNDVDAVQQLNALRNIERRAQIQALLPLIDELVRQGVSHAKIVQTASNAGIPMSLAAMRKALYRWRKRQTHPVARAPLNNPRDTLHTPPLTSKPSSPTAGGITSKADLVRLRNSQAPIDLNQLAEIGRQK